MLQVKETGRKRRKLDNAANAFPAAAGKKDSRVFRIYCRLQEEVIPVRLQKALDQAIVKYPLFRYRLKKGRFWYYFEKGDVKPVAGCAADEPLCRD